MSEWTLRDMDNRDDAGAPWEVTAPPAELVDYLNGPVRSDLADPSFGGTELLGDLIDAFESGDLPRAKKLGPLLCIHVREAGDGDE